MDSKSQEQTRLASVHFALLVDGLKMAGIWDQVRELHCSCERWLGPVRPLFIEYSTVMTLILKQMLIATTLALLCLCCNKVPVSQVLVPAAPTPGGHVPPTHDGGPLCNGGGLLLLMGVRLHDLQEVSFGPRVRVRAHLRLSERNARLNRKLLRAILSQPNLTELTISDMLPHDLDPDLVRIHFVTILILPVM